MKKSLFASSHPYYVVAPDYTPSSAGVRVMHTLAHALNLLGAEAYLTGCRAVCTALRTPLLTQDVVNYHRAIGRRAIAVYPEVVAGNPLQAKTVVRYILNRPGHLGGDSHYPDTDLLYVYDPWFLPTGLSATTLTIPVSDPALMTPPPAAAPPRQEFGVYARKYRAFHHAIDPAHADGLDLSQPERPPGVIADLLRQLTVIYCYEPSHITIDAILCGCPVVYVLSAYMPTRPARVFFGDDGVCETRLGQEPHPAALQTARHSLGFCSYRYLRLIERVWTDLAQFFERTQAAAEAG